MLLGILAGAMLGVGLFTFGYARGASYLTNDPQACANCHVMQEQLDGWRSQVTGKWQSATIAIPRQGSYRSISPRL
ncbi:MAG: hypothetical protein WKF37_11635 [Bryobacteraceae bacterium]